MTIFLFGIVNFGIIRFDMISFVQAHSRTDFTVLFIHAAASTFGSY